MIIVTGGAGFIGANIIKGLNQRGINNILVVDNLRRGEKFANLADVDILDYIDKEDFLKKITENHRFSYGIEAVMHQGACSSTTEWDGHYMMQNNYSYSKTLLDYCLLKEIPLIYASSAAVYGAGQVFREQRSHERALNVYGYSKFIFDQQVRRALPQANSPIVGLRYFNVYGPHEQHKGSMASVAYHFNQQLLQTGVVKLFAGCDGYADGEQRRDFIYIDDVVAVNLWFLDHRTQKGIFNVGTGASQSFNDVAKAVIAWHKKGSIEYIPFPDKLKGCYQSFTQADISLLRQAGFTQKALSVEEGVKRYLDTIAGRV